MTKVAGILVGDPLTQRVLLAIDEAKRHDIEYLRDKVNYDAIRSGRLAEYLLEEEMRERQYEQIRKGMEMEGDDVTRRKEQW